MKWFKETPVVDGWYWWTDEFATDPHWGSPVVVCVCDGDGSDIESEGWRPISEWVQHGVMWMGPLEEPHATEENKA